MPIKPSPTITGKLRKLFNNNKQTIEPAIDDSIPGGSGNVLTLYVGMKGSDTSWAYKNSELTEEYETREEAATALANADIIKLVLVDEDTPLYSMVYYPILKSIRDNSVYVEYCDGTAGQPSIEVGLWYEGSVQQS